MIGRILFGLEESWWPFWGCHREKNRHKKGHSGADIYRENIGSTPPPPPPGLQTPRLIVIRYNMLLQPKVRTTKYGLLSMRYDGARLWNNVMASNIYITNINEFKAMLKNHLYTCQCNMCIFCDICRLWYYLQHKFLHKNVNMYIQLQDVIIICTFLIIIMYHVG